VHDNHLQHRVAAGSHSLHTFQQWLPTSPLSSFLHFKHPTALSSSFHTFVSLSFMMASNILMIVHNELAKGTLQLSRIVALLPLFIPASKNQSPQFFSIIFFGNAEFLRVQHGKLFR
jgi:hypothetical protein